MKNYYEFLGVPENSSNEFIKSTYRQLVKIYHPDKFGGNDRKFREIQESWDVLGNTSTRSIYDKKLLYSRQPKSSSSLGNDNRSSNSTVRPQPVPNPQTSSKTNQSLERERRELGIELWRKSKRYLIYSFFWVLIGTSITAATYGNVKTSGGTYYVIYGPIIYGIYRIFKNIGVTSKLKSVFPQERSLAKYAGIDLVLLVIITFITFGFLSYAFSNDSTSSITPVKNTYKSTTTLNDTSTDYTYKPIIHNWRITYYSTLTSNYLSNLGSYSGYGSYAECNNHGILYTIPYTIYVCDELY